VNIQYLITELEVGGAEKALFQLVLGVRDRGHRVQVACLDRAGPVASWLRDAGVEVLDLDIRRSPRKGWRRLRRWIDEGQAEILHTYLAHANLLGRWGAFQPGGPRVICAVRVAERERREHLLLDALSRRLVHRYVAVSEAVGHFHAQRIGIPRSRMVAIANGVDSAQYEATPMPETSRPRILFVGRFHAQKRPLDLLRALAQLVRWEIPFEARLVGEGPLREQLLDRRVRWGLEDVLEIQSFQSEIGKEYREAHLLCLPSLWEGMPNVVLEAMSSARPVVATAVGGTPEVVVDGETGILVPPGDPSSLARALAIVLTDRELQRSMGQAGRRRVVEGFRPEWVVDRHLALYDEVLKDGSRGRCQH
jgi:glycosyltransferase involved in cell wall biosynthesis